ncbi:ABC transporter ATP-binding protein [Anaerosporobacter faecicola]|uniref:ABC transporter ATP-binding protein n=1 Tax=Anaerosporobacter faecicola TaxID=2718714 RepID=UPI00143BF25D|nr:ABC transporter ATP-binding protein [Anaerosporobacter faecicola]
MKNYGQTKECLFHIQNLQKSYDGKEILKGLTIPVYAGDMIGLLGPNGAGKSTMTKIIGGIEQKDAGTLLFHGKDVHKNPREFKRKLGIVPQEIALYEELSAYENIQFFASLYGLNGTKREKKIEEVLRFVGLWERRKETPAKYSGGMKRRLNIACSVVHDPEILIMDEPTVGIDPQSRNHIMNLIRSLQAAGTTVIYISHYIEEIEELCNRVIIMDHGQILVDEEKEALKKRYVEQGMDHLESIFLSITGTQLRDEVE